MWKDRSYANGARRLFTQKTNMFLAIDWNLKQAVLNLFGLS